jgi:hypothetical protein
MAGWRGQLVFSGRTAIETMMLHEQDAGLLRPHRTKCQASDEVILECLANPPMHVPDHALLLGWQHRTICDANARQWWTPTARLPHGTRGESGRAMPDTSLRRQRRGDPFGRAIDGVSIHSGSSARRSRGLRVTPQASSPASSISNASTAVAPS